MNELLEAVHKNIRDYHLIGNRDNILVSLSGGPDSTALLDILHRLIPKLGFSMAACYINHQIRSRKVIQREVKFCWELCQQYRIDFHVINENIPELAKYQKQSVETAAREFRYAVLKELAAEDDFSKIAFGHHLDDMIETILFRIFRGTGPQGLNPIKPATGIFIRPLFNIEKREIEQYLQKQKIVPMRDHTNFESAYSRNYIRNKVIPVIHAHFGDKYKASITNLSRILAEEQNYLESITQRKLKNMVYFTAGGKIVVDLPRLRLYDTWLKRRILKNIVEKMAEHSGAGTFDQIDMIDGIISGHRKAVKLSRELIINSDRELLIFRRKPVVMTEKELNIGARTAIPELSAAIKIRQIPADNAACRILKNGLKINIDFDRIFPPLYVRNIKPGDRFSPLGLRGTKKIGDFLTDRKVSQLIRDEIPVVGDKKGIIWLVGYQIADRVKITNDTKKVGEIEYIGKKGFGRAQIRSALFAG